MALQMSLNEAKQQKKRSNQAYTVRYFKTQPSGLYFLILTF